MGPAIAVIAAVASVVGTVQGVMSAQQAKKDAKRQLRLQQQQRALEQARQEATLRRESRIKRASIANAASQSGLQTSSVASGGMQAVSSAEQRDQSYLEQGGKLAAQGDAITRSQISNDAQSAVFGAISNGLSGFGNKNSMQQQGANTISSWLGFGKVL